MLKLIEEGSWLDDEYMRVTSSMLKAQFPNLVGIHDSILGQTLSFPVTSDPLVQIMHVNDHWITVARVSPSCAHVYDSVYSTVKDDTKMQIATLLHTAEDCISLVAPKIQYQVGNSDSDLFAIAYATDIAHGNDPASYKYEQDLH